MLVGYLLRERKLGGVSKAVTVLIWLLLFLLGVEVGGNRAIVTGLHDIGVEAAMITLGAVVGSVLFSWGLWRAISRSSEKQARK
jgi:uncharacterized membrane protein YbjE (DUF340 family)